MAIALQLYKPLEVQVDEQGYSTGRAVFLGSYDTIAGNLYPTLKIGLRYIDIISGLTDPDRLVISGIDYQSAELRFDNATGELLAEITVTATNREKEIETGAHFNFNVSIQSEIMTEKYRGNTFWAEAGLATPDTEKEVKTPYVILTLSGTYNLAVPVYTISGQLNTVNAAPWNLSQYSYSLGEVPAHCAKFVGFTYEESQDNTAAAPTCAASFTFHIRAFDWNYRVRPAEALKDPVTGEELFWQDKYSWLPTHVSKAATGVLALAGTPIWSGTNTVLGGAAAFSTNVYDREAYPRPTTPVTFGDEYPAVTWSFLAEPAPEVQA